MNDPVIAVAILGFFGTILTTIATVSVALFTNRSEKKKTADDTMDKVLRERITLRDEKVKELEEEIEDLKETIASQDLVIRELRGGVSVVRDTGQDSE